MEKCILYIVAGFGIFLTPGCYSEYEVIRPHRVIYTTHMPDTYVHRGYYRSHHHRWEFWRPHKTHRRHHVIRHKRHRHNKHVYKRNVHNRTRVNRHHHKDRRRPPKNRNNRRGGKKKKYKKY